MPADAGGRGAIGAGTDAAAIMLIDVTDVTGVVNVCADAANIGATTGAIVGVVVAVAFSGVVDRGG